MIGFIGGTRKNEILATIGPVIGYSVEEHYIDLSSVERTFSALSSNFDGDLDKNKLIEGANKGLVEAVGDPYTVYMNKEEADEFNASLNGDFGAGIGVEVGLRDDVPTVIRPLPNNPAIQAGVQAGDVLVEVNGESTSGKDIEQITNEIRGESGTSVKLKILRDKDYKEITVVREKINNPSVELSFDGDMAIMKISRFDEETSRLAQRYAKDIKDRGAQKVILDLRGNGGGYVSAAKDVASLWLSSGDMIVVEKFGDTTKEELKATNTNTLRGVKTVVLADQASASASEIVIGALKDNNVAQIIGHQSYGKGSVQQPITINRGSLLKVTVARWYTPSGVNLTTEGIKPDISVEITPEDINAGRDPQLDRAKEWLNK